MALYPVKSAERVIRILELYQTEQRSLTAAEVARALGWPSPSTLAVLKTLVGLGYLVFDNRSKVYFPSPRIARLCNWVETAFFEECPALDIAYKLSGELVAGVIVSVLNDLHVQYLLVLPGKDNARYGSTERGLRLVVDSCAGLTLLGELSEEAVDRICRRINIKYRSSADRVEPSAVTRLTRTFQRQGYGVLAGKPQPDIMALSMPLKPTRSGRRFAISVGGARETITRDRDRILEKMSHAISNAA